ncbi:MAG: hypothetical protein H5U02_12015 [Clostridia bacterium]|nr:hypothetical protein [Clostridia bacterium]
MERSLKPRMTEKDLDFLVRAVADRRNDYEGIKNIVRDKEDFIEIMLEDAKLFAKLLERKEELLFISPYFLFSILLRQVRRDLGHMSYTQETSGRERIPVFDAPKVRKAIEDNQVLDYLAELLTSFTRVQSYVLFYQVGSKTYRRLLSGMDIDDLIFLASAVDQPYRFELNRRVGDLALFVTGIFPEYISRPRGPLWRTPKSLEDYLEIGRRYYSLASNDPYAQELGWHSLLHFMSENLFALYKVLNLLSPYIAPQRSAWFGLTLN